MLFYLHVILVDNRNSRKFAKIIRKFVEVKNSVLFNFSYIEENTQNVTMNDFTPVMTVTLFDDTLVTGDGFSIILAVVVAIISIGAAKIIHKHRTSSLF